MTAITRLAVLAFVTAVSPVLVAQQPQPQAQSQADWQAKYALGLAHRTAADLYAALKAAASNRPQSPGAALPDWSGLWVGAGGGGAFRAGPGGVMPKLTPAAAAAVKAGQERNAKALSYDENLSQCGPAGHPRWLQEPFLREFAITPSQTYLINEMVNEIRRVYTDGRGHTPEADRYPLADGDSIGFWDGQKLVVHTNQLMARSMGRNQPTQSDQMETVEIWEQIDPRTMAVDAWLYDSTLYLEPWHLQRRYSEVPNADRALRIRHWDCNENPNNEVVKTPDDSTEFKGLTFTDKNKAGEPRR
jgi:hypothetical protein